MWDDIRLRLSKACSTIAIDLPGHGDSKTYLQKKTLTMGMIADSVKESLDKQQIKGKVILVGHSMGGYVALEFGKKYPNDTMGICLFHSTASEDSEQKKVDRLRAIELVKRNRTSFVDLSMLNLFSKENKTLFDQQIKEVQQEAKKVELDSIIAYLKGMRVRKENTYLLNDASFYFQIIVGKKDPIISLDTLTNQLKAKQIIDKELIDNCGHMGHIEAFEETCSSLLRFVNHLKRLN